MKHMTKKALALLLALLMSFPTITLAEVPGSATAIEAAQAMDAPVESPEEAVLSAPEADAPDESEEETDVSASEVEAPAELAGVFELGPDGPEAVAVPADEPAAASVGDAHSVSVDADSAARADIRVSASEAATDDDVTVTVSPKSGYVLDAIYYIPYSGASCEIVPDAGGRGSFKMPDADVVIYAEAHSPWKDLQAQFDRSEELITLDEDVRAGSDDGPLMFNNGHETILDLNGHTISREMAKADLRGYVLEVSAGTLVIRDSKGGSITGGKGTYHGGGVYVSGGHLELSGGSITGNTAEQGGGVYVTDTGSLTLWEAMTEPAFRAQSLLLNGEIGINFFLELPELEGVDYTQSYMEFTVHSRNGKTTRDNYDPSHRDVNGRGYYGFTVNVNAIQMAAPITAVFHYGDGQTIQKEYSVKEYILAYDKVSAAYDETTTALVHAVADYGHYAQPPLSDYQGWKIGSDYAEMNVYYTEDLNTEGIKPEVESFVIRKDLGTSEVERITFSLNMLTQTEMYIYVKLKDGYTGSAVYTLDDNATSAGKTNDGEYYIRVSNIPAHKLNDWHTVTVKTASGTATVTVAPMTYIRSFLKDSRKPYRESVASLYYYYKAALAYRAVHPQ